MSDDYFLLDGKLLQVDQVGDIQSRPPTFEVSLTCYSCFASSSEVPSEPPSPFHVLFLYWQPAFQSRTCTRSLQTKSHTHECALRVASFSAVEEPDMADFKVKAHCARLSVSVFSWYILYRKERWITVSSSKFVPIVQIAWIQYGKQLLAPVFGFEPGRGWRNFPRGSFLDLLNPGGTMSIRKPRQYLLVDIICLRLIGLDSLIRRGSNRLCLAVFNWY